MLACGVFGARVKQNPQQKREQMIPTFSRFLHGQEFLKREGP